MSGHTPGPWKTDTDDFHDRCIYDADGNWLANATSDDESPEAIARSEANTLLLASAPELLDALKAIMEAHGPGTLASEGLYNQAVAAINKAEGLALKEREDADDE
jgi:hypothetical protein